MATNPLRADAILLRPGIITGRHPNTGVLHRLTILTNGTVTIERKPYVSPLDGWTQHYETITEPADRHLFLILKIRQNPADYD